jgi:glycyl-tRNA synthetase beta chain
LRVLLGEAARFIAETVPAAADDVTSEVLGFVAERLRVQLRGEGARHDVLAAVFAAGADDDLVRLLARSEAVAGLLGSEDGRNLLAAYKRAANILRIEERKDGPHDGPVDAALLTQAEEIELQNALARAGAADRFLADERFTEAMGVLAGLRGALDAFFDRVTVNASDLAVRVNRLRLLASVRRAMNRVADFSAIEG